MLCGVCRVWGVSSSEVVLVSSGVERVRVRVRVALGLARLVSFILVFFLPPLVLLSVVSFVF